MNIKDREVTAWADTSTAATTDDLDHAMAVVPVHMRSNGAILLEPMHHANGDIVVDVVLRDDAAKLTRLYVNVCGVTLECDVSDELAPTTGAPVAESGGSSNYPAAVSTASVEPAHFIGINKDD